MLLLTLPGTPFLYAGEELGLEDAVVPPDRRRDPGGRDGCRAPIPWDATAGHGWGREPWLPFPPDAGARSVATLREDPGSILHLYRRLLAVRRGSPALAHGAWTADAAPAGVLAYTRTAGADRRRVLVNFGDAPVAYDARGTVVVATDGTGEGAPFGGSLGAAQAVVILPG